MSARGINRRLPIEVTASLINRFNAGVDKCGPNECWNWLNAFRNGYGAIKHQGRVLSAHRVAYVIAKGEPEDGLLVTHTCDNRACCNPAHLVAASPAQNVKDAHERSNIATVVGEMSPIAVLNDSIVSRIWSLRRTGLGARCIARELNIKEHQAKKVIRKEGWKHLIPSWAK